MQENTNKAIIINSVINYAKLFINTVLALLTTRFALKALGVDDFGLFSVLGSIMSFIGIFNTIMVTTCNRFLSVAIGKGNIADVNKQFNVNLLIFISIAGIILLVAYPVGHWYIHRFINYNGPIQSAMMVYCISIIGSIISTIAIPFNGLLLAKERFIVFSSVDVITHLIKFIVALLLLTHFSNKLLIYTIAMSSMTALPTIVFWIYCKMHFSEITKFHLVNDKQLYKQVFGFSGWVSYGAIACVARNQGAALLVNAFFNTAMNTALGLASSLNAYITMFANSLTQPMQPQIMKSYASGNYDRTDELLVMSTKFSFLLMLLVSCPFFVSGEWILGLWLGDVPEYVLSFTVLLIIDNLVQSFNIGISNMIFANGKIAPYQLSINTIRLLAIVAAYFILKAGFPPQSLFITYIVFSFFAVLATQWCLYHTIHYNAHRIIRESYFPSIIVLGLFTFVFLIPNDWNDILRLIISIVYLVLLEFFIGFSKKEKRYIVAKISNKLGH